MFLLKPIHTKPPKESNIHHVKRKRLLAVKTPETEWNNSKTLLSGNCVYNYCIFKLTLRPLTGSTGRWRVAEGRSRNRKTKQDQPSSTGTHKEALLKIHKNTTRIPINRSKCIKQCIKQCIKPISIRSRSTLWSVNPSSRHIEDIRKHLGTLRRVLDSTERPSSSGRRVWPSTGWRGHWPQGMLKDVYIYYIYTKPNTIQSGLGLLDDEWLL